MVIPAESNNAVDRFKQGFLVDSFKDFSIAAATNEEYKAAINKAEQTLVPKHKQNKINLQEKTNQWILRTRNKKVSKPQLKKCTMLVWRPNNKSYRTTVTISDYQ